MHIKKYFLLLITIFFSQHIFSMYVGDGSSSSSSAAAAATLKAEHKKDHAVSAISVKLIRKTSQFDTEELKRLPQIWQEVRTYNEDLKSIELELAPLFASNSPIGPSSELLNRLEQLVNRATTLRESYK